MKDEAVQADPAAIDVAVEAVSSPKAEVAPVTVEEKATTTTTEEKAVGTEEKAVEAPDLFEPLRTSLSSLSNEVTSYSKHIERDTEGAPTKLMSSLETLSSYISTQSFYATQAKFMPASSSSRSGSNYQLSNQDAPSMAPPSLPANEAAAQCRSEIRGLKGLLLNRCGSSLLFGLDDAPTSAQAQFRAP